MCERTRCTRVERSMSGFKDFINQSELKDLPMMGRQFSWTSFQNNAIHSRIDRILISVEVMKNLIWCYGDYQDQLQIMLLS
ncbi:hypothetical protein RHMOL_Rhmol05G0087300 [Rhododendron molle]|uniref:Uncharacterized protein n=1 Tax=Rhododendron molle TaxID=49168 RepID=A0ACC0NNX4_RHOML|nr:hypothetical protein RHMOL_Rhmol05G0087300 [Rhododendron molle]